LQIRGFIYYSIEDKDKALRDLKESLIYGFESKKTYEYIGYIYFYTYKNYKLAVESLKLSSTFRNDKAFIWYLITASQWQNKNCEFVESADIYAQKCKESGECKAKNVNWVVKHASHAKKTICK